MRALWLAVASISFALIVQAASPTKPPTLTAVTEPAYFQTGILTLQDRIWAQTQIERVFYNHRIWP